MDGDPRAWIGERRIYLTHFTSKTGSIFVEKILDAYHAYAQKSTQVESNINVRTATIKLLVEITTGKCQDIGLA